MALIDPRLTLEDLQAMPDDGRRHEILEGDLFVSPSPSRRHQRIVSNLAVVLRHLEDGGFGQALIAPFDVVLSSHTVVEPDALFVAKDREGILTERYVNGPPDIVVEVLSPTTRAVDQGEKLKAYARYGVREYWLVDPEAETVAVYRRSADSFPVAPDSAGRGEHVPTAVFPGVSVAVDEILRP